MDDPAAIQWARGTVRAEMAKRGLTYAKLVKRLKLYGVEENERNLRNKIARGTFSAAFMVQVMEAMGANEIPVGYLQAVRIMNKEPFDRNFLKGKLGDDLAEKRIAREIDEVRRSSTREGKRRMTPTDQFASRVGSSGGREVGDR